MHKNSFDNTSVPAAVAVNRNTSMCVLIGLCCVNNRLVSFALGFSFACWSFAHETRNRSWKRRRQCPFCRVYGGPVGTLAPVCSWWSARRWCSSSWRSASRRIPGLWSISLQQITAEPKKNQNRINDLVEYRITWMRICCHCQYPKLERDWMYSVRYSDLTVSTRSP